jgi:hypothetical protein
VQARRRWGIGAAVGLILGLVLLISGDRFGYHNIRVIGALVMGAGILCGVFFLGGHAEN